MSDEEHSYLLGITWPAGSPDLKVPYFVVWGTWKNAHTGIAPTLTYTGGMKLRPQITLRRVSRRVCRIAKSDYLLRHVCPSVHPHGKARLPRDDFSFNLILEYFSKICREKSSFGKILQVKRVFYMKSNRHIWWHLAQIFLEWETFQTKAV